ncbi:uncharacterized protein sS8_2980 [Methylocaldum marinum]|uniref:Uncharacterized protein n=1 Tax=Methylocaldum marinum TaxID=1432792 RepID=A0A250KTA9_9GAMM|nr:hypothetical protein [Methylocaldum marinum]BBA34923.1 uncharacterized protein sS8_2980 [Methylocaldum marinum]
MVKKTSSDTNQTGEEILQESTIPTTSESHEEAVMETTALDTVPATPVQAAVQGLQNGASDAREAVSGTVSNVSQTLSKLVYNGFYYLSYGVVYSALAVSNLIPTDNAMGEGLQAGAEAARKSFDEHQKERAAAFEPPADAGLATS